MSKVSNLPLNPTKLLPVALLCLVTFATAKDNDLLRETPVPADQPIPVSDFFRSPEFRSPRLSPDGKHYAAIVTVDGATQALLVGAIDTGKFGKVDPAASKDVYWFDWATADRLLYKLSTDKHYARGIYTARVPSVSAISTFPIERYSSTLILSYPRATPTKPLVWVIRNAYEMEGPDRGVVQIDADRSLIKDRDEHPGMRGANASTNSDLGRYGLDATVLRTFPLPPASAVNYLCDNEGALNYCITATAGTYTLHRLAGDTWQKTPVDLDRIDIIDTGDTPEELIVAESGQSDKPFGLRRMNATTGALGETVFSDPAYDGQSVDVIRQPKTDRIVGFGVSRARWQNVWLDQRYADIQAFVAQQFPQECISVVDTDDAEQRFLIATWSDRKPRTFYLADTVKKTFSKLASARPWIDPARMLPSNVVRYKTRDGHEVEGYLTLPAGTSKTAPAPLVVLPHGGPWVRDDWSWDPEVQFLASRGYAVFQPNYRGSTGYTWRFPASDLWAFRKMHNDVTDGVAAMKRTGLIDPDRIAIMGGSFGGYLAMCGAAFEPETYRCAITMAGVFDWAQMIREVKNLDDNSLRSQRFLRKLGDPARNQEYFESISPIKHLDAVKVPVFVWHGRIDNVVDVEQSKRLVAQLRDHGIPCTAVFERSEGHGAAEIENRIELYTKIEQFLATNLAPRTQTLAGEPAPRSKN